MSPGLVGKDRPKHGQGHPRSLGWTQVEASDAAIGMHGFEEGLARERLRIKGFPLPGQLRKERVPILKQVIHAQRRLVQEFCQIFPREPRVVPDVLPDQLLKDH